jgi:hypothetical protein
MSDARTTWTRSLLTVAGRAIMSPRLASDLVRTGWRFRRRGWWHRAPFLPLPAREYLRLRTYTAYGDANAIPSANDIIRYARWAVRSP